MTGAPMRHAVEGCPEGGPARGHSRPRALLALPLITDAIQRILTTDTADAVSLHSGKHRAQAVNRDFQVVDGLTGFGGNHLRHQVAMAVIVVSFKAQQTAPLLQRQSFRFGQRPLRFWRFHMGLEDRHHPFRVPGPDCVAPRFGGPETLEVDVTDSGLVETGRELTFREAGFSGSGHRTHVDQQANSCFPQYRQHAVDRAAFIADSQQIGRHGRQPVANQSSIKRRAMLSARGN
jgi:hypothetical protein